MDTNAFYFLKDDIGRTLYKGNSKDEFEKVWSDVADRNGSYNCLVAELYAGELTIHESWSILGMEGHAHSIELDGEARKGLLALLNAPVSKF